MNREQWLQAAVEKLRPIFLGHGYTVKEVQVSVGFPSRNPLGLAKRSIGQCWDGSTTKDGKPQIFISPLLDDVATDPQGVLATLVHELVHATIGCEAAHGPKFAKAAKKLGLDGKPTSTHAGDDLIVRLKQIADELGEFPHTKLVPGLKLRKKQTTRMKKCVCDCGYTVRLTKKWMDEVGLPICPGGTSEKAHGPMNVELPKDEGEDPEGEGDE